MPYIPNQHVAGKAVCPTDLELLSAVGRISRNEEKGPNI